MIFKTGERVEVYTAVAPNTYGHRIGTVRFDTPPGPNGRVWVRLDKPANGGHVEVRPEKKHVRKVSILELIAREAADE